MSQAPAPSTPRLCLHCEHFVFEVNSHGTPHASCRRTHWRTYRPPVGSKTIHVRDRLDLLRVVEAAEGCPDFADAHGSVPGDAA